MKPVNFDYIRPNSLSEALTLAAGEEETEFIAGGQTLVPLLNLRMARPSILIDISRIADLQGISCEGERLWIGGATRQLEIEESEIVRKCCPLLHKVLPWIGHRPTRARGTIGGSLATADPAAELSLVGFILDADIEIQTLDGTQNIAIEDFILGPLETSLLPGACITSVSFPIWTGGEVATGFRELSTRRSDFAIASAAVQLLKGPGGSIDRAAIAVGACGDRPQRLSRLEYVVAGKRPAEISPDIYRAEIENEIQANGHIHASSNYGKRAAAHLAIQALGESIMELSQ